MLEQNHKPAVPLSCQEKSEGMVQALPHIHFQIMDTVNTSMKYSSFPLHLGHSPHVIPPIVPLELPSDLLDAANAAVTTIQRLTNDITEA